MIADDKQLTTDPSRNPLLCIVGPTASGKTHLAVAVALAVDGEIISADSRQVYRGLDIGTGKDLDEYCVEGRTLPYHLIDIVDCGHEFNVFEFQQAFLEVHPEILERGRTPIMCGGTGMYVSSILDGYKLVKTPGNEELRDELRSETEEQLARRLSALRPLHNVSDTSDRKRLVRAIEIATYSQERGGEEDLSFPELNTKVFAIAWERDELKRRITDRLKARLDNGLVEEVESLLKKGLSPEQLLFYGLEYRYLTMYVTGQLNRNDMFQKLNSAIHGFAKRQMTWFRRMERKGTKINWLPGQMPLEDKVGRILGFGLGILD